MNAIMSEPHCGVIFTVFLIVKRISGHNLASPSALNQEKRDENILMAHLFTVIVNDSYIGTTYCK